jgi:hypothetical protein
MPLVFKAIFINVERLLNLTDAVVVAQLALTVDQLRSDPWWEARARGEESLTQAVGRAAKTSGLQALMAASAQTLDHGSNIIAFPDLIKPPSLIKVVRRAAK